MIVCSKYIGKEGKIESLPKTIEQLFKKNKRTYEEFKYLSNKIGMDCRQYPIKDIANYVELLKKDNNRMREKISHIKKLGFQ
mmetsp:Transcript_30242/g.26803  ORF Transcript_30242/g.26803 Transcript_30242/m.26803 type:complete len:82 (+) Transcript_30242:1255-1500(+)